MPKKKSRTQMKSRGVVQIWWVCVKRGHFLWLATIYSCVMNGSGCPKGARMDSCRFNPVKPNTGCPPPRNFCCQATEEGEGDCPDVGNEGDSSDPDSQWDGSDPGSEWDSGDPDSE